MKEILNYTFWNNTVEHYLIALTVFIGGIILIQLARKIAYKFLKAWAEKSNNTLDDFFVELLVKNLMPILNLGALFAAVNYLTLTPKAEKILKILYAVAITWFLVRIVLKFIRQSMEVYAEKQEDPETKKKQLRSLMAIVKVLVWAIALIFLLSNLGFNVTGIVTGLGIGGIAIALAAQTILGDLFSYFVIFFDKPFEPGDFITVDDKQGTVEKVGLKTTRIRALTGELLIMSNTSLTNARVHNYKQMERRRVNFKLGVTYQTPSEKLQNIPGIIQEVITQQENASFDRAHFSNFGEFSLIFDIVYFVEVPDMVTYMNTHQAINLGLYRAFEKEGVHFAYPTQTVYEYKMENSI
jgi:small-conductance mechanosensitive channel